MTTLDLDFDIRAQPTPTTCGPTGLHAVYGFFEDDPPDLDEVIGGVDALEAGGTLGALLAVHALRRGYKATLHTYNLEVFDPSWFGGPEKPALDRAGLVAKLEAQLEAKPGRSRLSVATAAYLDFLRHGGELRRADLSPRLIRRLLDRELPLLAGLSATWLYSEPREIGETNTPHDLLGEPAGHFVVLAGYDARSAKAQVADPLQPNAHAPDGLYAVPFDRLVTAILLGVLTYDANLLQIEPGPRR